VDFAEIKALIETLPEVSGWPELAEIFERAGDVPRPDWELPVLACRAVGGDETSAKYGAAAIACLQLSIILVDDILDDDPRGAHNELGAGYSANLALAYEATAITLAELAASDPRQSLACVNCLTRAALATAVGQQLDIKNFQGEEDYWRVVTAKSTPFYGAALQLGSLIGGAGKEVSSGMYELGITIGEIIQLEDDLADALERPANADWLQGRNNLLILFARTADHQDRQRFLELIPRVDQTAFLVEAQDILVSSGAVGYCAYQLVERYRRARRLLAELNLSDSSPLDDILDSYADTLIELLRVSGQEISHSILLESEEFGSDS
jgi:geranylgeranyl pyrophosphate synthase